MSTKLISMKCPECGAEVNAEEGREQCFCSYCGAKILLNREAAPSEAAVQPDTKAAETPQTHDVQLRVIEAQERVEAHRTKQESLKLTKLAIAAVIILLIAGIIVGFSLANRNGGRPKATRLAGGSAFTVDSVREAIAPASEMAVYKYNYEANGTQEKNKKLFSTNIVIPLTTDEVVFIYAGTIGIGLDVGLVRIDVNNVTRTVELTMPEMKLLYHEIDSDSFKSYNVRDSIFTSFSMEDFNELETALKKEREENLQEQTDIWEKAKIKAEDVIKGLILAMPGSEEYTVRFVWSK